MFDMFIVVNQKFIETECTDVIKGEGGGQMTIDTFDFHLFHMKEFFVDLVDFTISRVFFTYLTLRNALILRGP